MNIPGCHNVTDFHRLAQRRIPFPVFDYFDGAAELKFRRVLVLVLVTKERT